MLLARFISLSDRLLFPRSAPASQAVVHSDAETLQFALGACGFGVVTAFDGGLQCGEPPQGPVVNLIRGGHGVVLSAQGDLRPVQRGQTEKGFPWRKNALLGRIFFDLPGWAATGRLIAEVGEGHHERIFQMGGQLRHKLERFLRAIT
jgi:hypothetical protein